MVVYVISTITLYNYVNLFGEIVKIFKTLTRF